MCPKCCRSLTVPTLPSWELGSGITPRTLGGPRHHSEGQRPSVPGRARTLTQVLQFNVAQNIEAALLEVIDKVDEAGTAPWVLHHQQHLWAPELDMVLPHVQHQQVLPHLKGEGQQVRNPLFNQLPTGMPIPRTGARDRGGTETPSWGHQLSTS